MTDSVGQESIPTPDGVFWADHIKTLRDQPLLRLTYARDFLPLPAAFREAAVALRALIREAQGTANFGPLLSELYLLAAQEAFLYATPYISGVGSGFNVAFHIERAAWEGLEMPYRSIGYERLGLLNKTDRKRIQKEWGNPHEHRCPQEFHNSVWDQAVEAVRVQHERQHEEFQEYVDAFFGPGRGQSSWRRGWLGSFLSRLKS